MVWLILLLPLAAVPIGLLAAKDKPKLAGQFALACITISFLLTAVLTFQFFQTPHHPLVSSSFAWIFLPGLTLEFGTLINPLSLLMLLAVTGVAAFIFYYSIGYMEGDPGFARYFIFLSFFTFSMIGIVIAGNFLQLFIFWELVGLSSYLLIGFWYEKPAAADAGKKAFVTNRLGDYGFLLGILLLWAMSGPAGHRTLDFQNLQAIVPALASEGQPWVTLACLLIFCGIAGKSAQFPLHVWLPDAMEGPTPVSALIHAATMVAAGVFLLARAFFLFSASPLALEIIAGVGAFTAVFAASQALVQIDLKRILAYSTLSQLGYMVMAAGLGSAGIAMYHLTTHAFFKALLFLCAGSILHMTHEQNIQKMGRLGKEMPVTAITFLIGAAALAGLYPTSGFWSKDEILLLAYDSHPLFFWIGTVTAFLTALYITRAAVLVFFGRQRELKKKASDPDHWMLVPMILLAVLSLFAGSFGIEHALRRPNDITVSPNTFVPMASSAAAWAGILTGVWIYQFNPLLANTLREKSGWFYDMLVKKYFIDAFYDFVLEHIQKPFSEACNWFERRLVVDTMVNGTAKLTGICGNLTRKLQTGKVQTYMTVFLGAVALIIYCFLVRGLLA